MALRKILSFPDSRLRTVTKEISDIQSEEIQTLIDDMFETMYHAKGVGLAATQIGVEKRIAVIDISQEHNQPMVLINPVIVERRGKKQFEEGCLSVPGHYDTLTRAEWVKLAAIDRYGKSYELEADGLLAECIQHELDHLDGKLYIDYLSELKRERIKIKLKKSKRRET